VDAAKRETTGKVALEAPTPEGVADQIPTA
jgi:hypothetical protein